MMWKILKALISEEIYNSLVYCRLFLEEQKGCHRGTGDLLGIDRHAIKESKAKRKNVAMARIDDKISDDMVPQYWIMNR